MLLVVSSSDNQEQASSVAMDTAQHDCVNDVVKENVVDENANMVEPRHPVTNAVLQWRFYVGARGGTGPPKSCPGPPNFFRVI